MWRCPFHWKAKTDFCTWTKKKSSW
jgi:hypothetical protein